MLGIGSAQHNTGHEAVSRWKAFSSLKNTCVKAAMYPVTVGSIIIPSDRRYRSECVTTGLYGHS